MRVVAILNALRVSVFITSLIAFICHIAQCALLDVFQQQTTLPSWTEAGHWQYLVWYIALSISMLSGALVCARACCCKRAHLVQGDRFLGFINFFTLLAAILAALITGSPEPWTAGYVKVSRPMWSFITSCSGDGTFSAAGVAGSSVSTIKLESSFLYERCVLSDSTWLGAALALLCWVLLVCFAVLYRPASSVAADLFKEPKWGRYIPEPPPSLRSASIQIVPPPPPHHLRHSVLYNSYVQPQSIESFDSQSISTTLSYGKRASWQWYHDEYSNTAGGYTYHHRYSPQQQHRQVPYYTHQPPIVPMLPMVPQMDHIDLFDSIPPTDTSISGENTHINSDSRNNPRHASSHEELQQQDYYGSRPVSSIQQELVMTSWDCQQQQQPYDHYTSNGPPSTHHFSSHRHPELSELSPQHRNHLSVESVPVFKKPQQY
ncbi:hypothetical protein BX666DRAFT_968658 [Dichotomocladium elegans]|nr:hypothetical protein BX666DRAFT_968658 [Dichotomocladium elegans]